MFIFPWRTLLRANNKFRLLCRLLGIGPRGKFSVAVVGGLPSNWLAQVVFQGFCGSVFAAVLPDRMARTSKQNTSAAEKKENCCPSAGSESCKLVEYVC